MAAFERNGVDRNALPLAPLSPPLLDYQMRHTARVVDVSPAVHCAGMAAGLACVVGAIMLTCGIGGLVGLIVDCFMHGSVFHPLDQATDVAELLVIGTASLTIWLCWDQSGLKPPCSQLIEIKPDAATRQRLAPQPASYRNVC